MPKLTRKAKARRKLILKWRRFLGLCISCGAEAWGNALCDRCQDRQNKAMAKRREKNKVNSLCQECGGHVSDGDGYRCDRCLELMRARRKRKCHTEGCNNDIAYRCRYCQECLDLKKNKVQPCKVYFIKCKNCNELFTSSRKGKSYCSNKCYRANSDQQSIKRIRKKKGLVLITKTCAYYRCNNIFQTYNSNKTTCSELCSKRMIKRNENQRRRAVKRGAKRIEKVDIKELFKRDLGRCRLCGKKLNLKRKVPHPLAATVDHIVPLSTGGEHSYRNTQLACFMCNSIKGNGFQQSGEQLRLFG